MKTTIDVTIPDDAIADAASKRAADLVGMALAVPQYGGRGGDVYHELRDRVNAAVLAYLDSDEHRLALAQLVESRITLAVDEIAGKVAMATVRKAAKS